MSDLQINILSIDDNKVTTELERAGYRKMNVTLFEADDFQNAENILKETPIDIIVVNFDYEEVNSLLLCQHFKTDKKTKEIPLVFTSVQARPKGYKNLVKAGMDLFIEQPIPRQYFIEKLRGVLDQKLRTENRLNHKGMVNFKWRQGEMRCTIADLSQNGLLLLTEEELALNEAITMSFTLPKYKKPISVTGQIVRRIPPENKDEEIGFGIRFESFNGDSKKRLEKYLGTVKAEDPKMIYYL